MRKNTRSKKNDKWLKALGTHFLKLIEKKGYKSPYDFWVQKAGDDISRSALNYILNGEVDAKATTLKKLANALDVDAKEIFNF